MTNIDIEKLHGMRLSNGRYELICPAANKTNMSIVYETYDHQTQQTVALKILLPGTSPTLRQRFEREAALAYHLTHQNVVSTIDYNLDDSRDNGLIYLVMRWLPGKTLDVVIKKRDDKVVESSQLLETACQILTKIGGALDYVHEQGIIHRDIKPSNIMWIDGEPYLLDFGIAKKTEVSKNVAPDATQVDDEENLTGDLTRLGTAAPGTPRYMSPEQILSEQLDGRSDQYSMALVIYEYLGGAGSSPYTITGSSTQRTEWQSKRVHEEPRPITKFRPDIPKAVSEVLKKALSRRPDERYLTLSAFAQAFCEAAKPPQPRNSIVANLPLPLLISGTIGIILILSVLVAAMSNGVSTDDDATGTAIALVNGTGPILVTLASSDTPTLLPDEMTATQQSIDATRIADIATENAHAQTLQAVAELTFVAQTPSATLTLTLTIPPTATPTFTPTASITSTATPSATATPQPTDTPLPPTAFATATATPTSTATIPVPVTPNEINVTMTINTGTGTTPIDTPTMTSTSASISIPVPPTALPTDISTPTEEPPPLSAVLLTPAVTATPTPCQRADLNGDGIVDEKDLALLETVLYTEVGDDLYSTLYDLNMDGRINSVDYSMVFAVLGFDCTPFPVLSECQSADVNSDGIIDQADLLLLDDLLGVTIGEPEYRSEADVNRDGTINAFDQRLIIIRLGQICAEVDTPEAVMVTQEPVDPCIQADLNQDGTVDDSDLEVIDNLFGASADDMDYNPPVDLNDDGTIDFRDQNILLERIVICDQ